jgi:hypothetical protein
MQKEIGILHVHTGVHGQPVQIGFEQFVGVYLCCGAASMVVSPGPTKQGEVSP